MVVGDVGVPLEITVTENGSALDISASTTRQILLRSPGGTLKAFSAALSSGGVDGKMRFTTTATTDIDVAGWWEIQGRVVVGSRDIRTAIGTFNVAEKLQA